MNKARYFITNSVPELGGLDKQANRLRSYVRWVFVPVNDCKQCFLVQWMSFACCNWL